MSERGKFIVFEGLDRSGKSTASKYIRDKIALSHPVQLIFFPNRTTPVGKLINEYLTNQAVNLPPQALHLLFSANRWECEVDIEAKLKSGINVICDRYFHSGIAYSYANGLDIEWARQPDKGLLEPDLIIFLESSAEALAQRKGYGQQVFQRVEFQKRVSQGFNEILADCPKVSRINVEGLSMDETNLQVQHLVRHKFDII